jgi:hypothetical protein
MTSEQGPQEHFHPSFTGQADENCCIYMMQVS